MLEIKPCPHCGYNLFGKVQGHVLTEDPQDLAGEAMITPGGAKLFGVKIKQPGKAKKWFFQCPKCLAQGPRVKRPSDALRAWNLRTAIYGRSRS